MRDPFAAAQRSRIHRASDWDRIGRRTPHRQIKSRICSAFDDRQAGGEWKRAAVDRAAPGRHRDDGGAHRFRAIAAAVAARRCAVQSLDGETRRCAIVRRKTLRRPERGGIVMLRRFGVSAFRRFGVSPHRRTAAPPHRRTVAAARAD
ncbi:hypothetical protein [Burkholderia sp. BDU5]|uniref:hypothetical protein n=1 Tax=Burkholderia sp. BDU5 TaxID=1385590 RepID=UPI0012E3B4E0|nr:hypothetical protein [Burkholderia sp. BDU5]